MHLLLYISVSLSLAKLSSATIAAITIPVLLIVALIVVGIILAVVLVFVLMKQRKGVSSQFAFRSMDSGDIQDDEKVIIEPPTSGTEENQSEGNDL